MTIIVSTHDLPLGVTPQEAAALVCGAERASRDVLIVVDALTEPSDWWKASMRKRFANQPMPAFIKECVGDDIAPPVSLQQARTEVAPADSESVSASPDYRGITFANLAIEAAEHGLTLTAVGTGYKLQNGTGCIVRKSLAELAPIIRSAAPRPAGEAANGIDQRDA